MKSPLNDIDVIVLAGGKGSRLRAVLRDRPKPMALINGKPFLEWQLLWLQSRGIKKTVLSIGHMADQVVTYFDQPGNKGMELIYARDPFPLGTGGAVRYALQYTKSKQVFVLNGDSHCAIDFPSFLKFHLNRQANVTIGLVRVDDCGRYGSVSVDEQGEIQAFIEKDSNRHPGMINGGIYLFERQAIEAIPGNKNLSLERDFFPGLVGRGLYGYLAEGFFLDIGTPDSLSLAEKIMAIEFQKSFSKEESKNDYQPNSF